MNKKRSLAPLCPKGETKDLKRPKNCLLIRKNGGKRVRSRNQGRAEELEGRNCSIGIRTDAGKTERENERTMSNERNEYRKQNGESLLGAEVPTASPVGPQADPVMQGEGPAGVVSRNAPRQLSPMGKAISVVLSVLLVLTTWNSYSIEEARSMIIGDEATPMASGTGDEIVEEIDDENVEQTANESEGAEAGDAAAAEDAVADDTVSEADMQAYLPKDLSSAEEVFPSLSDDAQNRKVDGTLTSATTSEDDLRAALADRISFSLAAGNALRASDGAYQVGGSAVALVPSFGNTSATFDGGHLGGTESTDVVALTFTAPYLYQNASGEIKQTLSREEWLARGADEQGMRAQIAFSDLPAGWTVYTEHRGQYLKHTAEEAAEGLSGSVLLRYEGVQDEHGITVNDTRGQMPAGTALPKAQASFAGNVPAETMVKVQAGYFVGSYTAAVDEAGKAKADSIVFPLTDETAAEVTLSAAEPQVSLAGSVGPYATTEVENGKGFAVFLINVTASRGTLTERGYTLRVTDEPQNAEGVGALSAKEMVAFDATGLSDDELAALNPAQPATIGTAGRGLAVAAEVAPGVADLTFSLEDEGALSADAVTGETSGERVLYVAVPYSEEALTAGEGNAFAPESASFALTAEARAKTVQEEKSADAASINDTLADEDVAVLIDLGAQEITLAKKEEPQPTDKLTPSESPSGDTDDASDSDANKSEESSGSTMPQGKLAINDESVETPESALESDAEKEDGPITLEAMETFNDYGGMMTMYSRSAPLFGALADDSPVVFFSTYSGGSSSSKVLSSFFNPNVIVDASKLTKMEDIANGFMVKETDTPTFQIDFAQNINNGYLGGTAQSAPVLYLYVPYFYINDAGGLGSTYDVEDWKKKSGMTSVTSEGAMYMGVTPNAAMYTNWTIHDMTTNKQITTANMRDLYPNGLVGCSSSPAWASGAVAAGPISLFLGAR